MLKSFFCMSLSTAGALIGLVGVIGSVFAGAYVLCYPDSEPNKWDISGVPIRVALLFELMVSILLLVGTIRESRCMFLPWLTLTPFLLISLGARIIREVTSQNEDFKIREIGLHVLPFTILVYSWCAIYSFYKQLQTNIQSKFDASPNLQKPTRNDKEITCRY